MKCRTIAIGLLTGLGLALPPVSAQTTPQRQPLPGVPIPVRQTGAEEIPEFSIRERKLEMELQEALREIRDLEERVAEAETPEGRRLRAERRLDRSEAARERLQEERNELRASLRETQARLRDVERERDDARRDAQRAQDRLERETSRESGRRARRREEGNAAPSAEVEAQIARLEQAVESLRGKLATQMALSAQYREFAQRTAEEAPPARVPAGESELIDQGLIAFEEGDLRRARRLLERAARQHEDDASLHGYLGAVYFAQGQHERARRSLEQAVALNPVDPAMHFNLAVLLASLDPPELDTASMHYQESLRLGGDKDELLQARLNGE